MRLPPYKVLSERQPDSFGLGGTAAVREALTLLNRTDRLDVALIAEGKAAEAYWDAWADVPIEFARRDRVPDHWRSFGMRRSPLTLGPRNAANPLNAMLNYLYTLLEVETRLALIARGLDPGLALFHADSANRQSLAADVMEPVRPHVDAFVLNLARTRTFSAKDFAETRDGACRLAASLTQELAPTMATWAKLVTPYAEAVARHVGYLAKSGLGVTVPIGPKPSPKRARVSVRLRPIAASSTPKVSRSVPISAASNACRSCGAKLMVRKRVHCDRCLPGERKGNPARRDSALQGRWAGEDRCHARSRLRSNYDARSATLPRRHCLAAAQSYRRMA
ncbi:MAG: CRISPR-associated endonuclease Cas1 [Candidatus Cybelea sp.]